MEKIITVNPQGGACFYCGSDQVVKGYPLCHKCLEEANADAASIQPPSKAMEHLSACIALSSRRTVQAEHMLKSFIMDGELDKREKRVLIFHVLKIVSSLELFLKHVMAGAEEYADYTPPVNLFGNRRATI